MKGILGIASIGAVLVLAGCGAMQQITTTAVSHTTTRPSSNHPTFVPVPAGVIAEADGVIAAVECDSPNALGGGERFLGTSFELSNLFVTAAHVVSACAGGAQGQLALGGQGGDTSIITDDVTHDIAILTLNGVGGPPSLRPETSAVQVGEPIALLGYSGGAPEGDEIPPPPTVRGIVVGANRRVTLHGEEGVQETLSDAIQVSASGISPGASGGLAIDANGNVVGVIEGSGGDGLVFLTPVSDVVSDLPNATALPPSTGPTSTPTTPTGNASWRNCDPNVQVTTDATCPFAANVFTAVWQAYKETGQIPSSISAFSPVTDQSYRLTCEVQATQVVCTNVSDEAASIQFPLTALQESQGP